MIRVGGGIKRNNVHGGRIQAGGGEASTRTHGKPARRIRVSRVELRRSQGLPGPGIRYIPCEICADGQCRHQREVGLRLADAPSLVIDEEKGLALDDRPAERSAEIVALKRRDRQSWIIEIV